MPSVTGVDVSLCTVTKERLLTDEDGLDAVQGIVLGDLILFIESLHSYFEAVP